MIESKVTTNNLIENSLKKCDIKSGDTIMLHGDAAVALQMNLENQNRNLKLLFDKIISYLGKNGTLIVPTFSYSFTEGKDFDVENTPSKLGIFSEHFRKRNDVIRSKHPMFSVSAIGKHSKSFQNSDIKTCFGKDTAFDLLFNFSGKIVCFGCSFNRITFAHFVEEKLKVKYRYQKKFSGWIIKNKKKEYINTNFFVRDLKVETETELNILKEKLKSKLLLNEADIGRFKIYSVKSKDFFKVASNLLKKDPFALIKKNMKEKKHAI